jgi:hypothetical protein
MQVLTPHALNVDNVALQSAQHAGYAATVVLYNCDRVSK